MGTPPVVLSCHDEAGSVDFQWGIISSCLAVPGDTQRCSERRAWEGEVNE
jgi:hypothetical protein